LPWGRRFRRVIRYSVAERTAMRRFHYLLASSPEVARELQEAAPTAHVSLAPLCLDDRHYSSASLDGPPIAGVIGTASWYPTARAVERLIKRVWPKVRRRVPDARLLIAGRGMEPLRGGRQSMGIEVLGEVESAPGFLKRLSVVVYPIERGSGMKIKVLEAMACGVPVITTEAGAEGIVRNGGVIVESDDERLAEASVRVLLDTLERKQRGQQAHEAFIRRYAPEPATESLIPLYETMMGS
jgi:polysaccharide biosynthesis protein PslH